MRINCIDVSILADQHLRAEWVEILMLPPYIKRSLQSKNGLILSEMTDYTLGTGHARFFYNKLSYVIKRYNEIEKEMIKRGYKANPALNLVETLKTLELNSNKKLFNDWKPTKKDKSLNLDRIIKRIDLKPLWYSYYGKKRFSLQEWETFYISQIY